MRAEVLMRFDPRLLPFDQPDSRFAKAFRSRFTPGAPDECWPWAGHVAATGYGMMCTTLGRRRVQNTLAAHRLAKSFELGRWVGAAYICHTCDNRPCVNPRHLVVADAKWNATDCKEKKRNAWGERGGTALLTNAIVMAARERCHAGEPAWKLAREYGVPYYVMYNAVTGKTYYRLPNPAPPSPRPRRGETVARFGIGGGPGPRGSASPMARLNETFVHEIREACARGEIARRIAARYGISIPLVYAIKHRRCWAWLPDRQRVAR